MRGQSAVKKAPGRPPSLGSSWSWGGGRGEILRYGASDLALKRGRVATDRAFNPLVVRTLKSST